MKTGANTSAMVAKSLIKTCSEGPAVSLNGSPTVSPTTAASCASEPFPRTLPSSSSNSPDSMYFLALSQAPPLLLAVRQRDLEQRLAEFEGKLGG